MKRPLRVLIVSQPTSFGVAVYARHLTEAAIAAGHVVTVACPASDRGPLARWVEDAGARHAMVNMSREPSPRDLINLLSIRRLARDSDVVHLHSSKAGALGRMALASLGQRRPALVFTPHYWSWLVGGRLAGLYRLIERVLARRCDVIVAVSEREAAEGRRVLGVSDRITLIHNGVDRDRFTPHGVHADRDRSSRLIVCVGRLSHQKGQDVAIRALACSASRTARLRLVGSESSRGERERLEALAAALGVGDRIEWRAEVADAAPELRAADVVIAPSRWEGMSLVFLEAMACGAAMVVTDVSGSEVVAGVGLVVAPDDPPALARAIDTLLADDALRRRLGEASRERSRAYDLRSTLNMNLDLWSDLAHGRLERTARTRGGDHISPASVGDA